MSEIWCFIICFGSSVGSPAGSIRSAQVDTFCATYQQVVITKEDLDKMKSLPRAMRDRVQGNDLEYLCRCKDYKHTLCEARERKS